MSQKGFSLLLIITAVLIAVLIAGSSYYLGTKHVKVQQLSTPPITSQVISTSPSLNTSLSPAANWNTYRNTQYSVSFNYPQTYTISTDTSAYGYPCNGLTSNHQAGCLLDLTINASISSFAPHASFYLLKGINSVEVAGQINVIKFNSQSHKWIKEGGMPNNEQVLPVWSSAQSGLDIIKTTNGGSEASSYFYIIPDYKNDIVAIFAIPQSYELRCDDFSNDLSKQAQCNTFYKQVVNQYSKGQASAQTWLPENYIKPLFSDAETMIKSFTFNAH